MKTEKPWYKRWWIIALLLFTFLIIVGSLTDKKERKVDPALKVNSSDTFDLVDRMLRHGILIKREVSGVYRDGSSLSKDLIKGSYVYCFSVTANPVNYPDTKTTFVVMWKEQYDKAKGPGNGKTIMWVSRGATGHYQRIAEGMSNSEVCSYKEALLIADAITAEANIKNWGWK
jgi:hypothetical protein